MISNPLIFVATSGLAGKTRGKSFPVSDLEKRLGRGVGWTPTNVQITCFNAIAESPFGAFGDLLLIPDASADVMVDFEDGSPVERFMIGDITDLDGAPWDFCTRAMLRTALNRLRVAGGVRLVSAFEHEFQFLDGNTTVGDGYSLNGFSKRRRFGQTLMGALEQAGIQPDTFMAEYGPSQYEVTTAPAPDHQSADQAVILRELTRMTATRCDERVSFTPILNPDSVGNGTHIHMSLTDETGTHVTFDGSAPAGMSRVTGSFIAGVLKYLDAIIALTAPSDVSYLRLTPHRWSAAYNNLGFRDREAAVRICPVTSVDPDRTARQYNFEFRAADAAASPHLALAAIIHAGAQGIEDNLPLPDVSDEDLSLLPAEELTARGYVRLPQSLEEALGNFERNQTVTGWFPTGFADLYTAHKRCEIAYLGDADVAARCAAYADVY